MSWGVCVNYVTALLWNFRQTLLSLNLSFIHYSSKASAQDNSNQTIQTRHEFPQRVLTQFTDAPPKQFSDESTEPSAHPPHLERHNLISSNFPLISFIWAEKCLALLLTQLRNHAKTRRESAKSNNCRAPGWLTLIVKLNFWYAGALDRNDLGSLKFWRTVKPRNLLTNLSSPWNIHKFEKLFISLKKSFGIHDTIFKHSPKLFNRTLIKRLRESKSRLKRDVMFHLFSRRWRQTVNMNIFNSTKCFSTPNAIKDKVWALQRCPRAIIFSPMSPKISQYETLNVIHTCQHEQYAVLDVLSLPSESWGMTQLGIFMSSFNAQALRD